MSANGRQWLAGNYTLTDPYVNGAHGTGARSVGGNDFLSRTWRRDCRVEGLLPRGNESGLRLLDRGPGPLQTLLSSLI